MTRPPQGRGEREGAPGWAWIMKIYFFNRRTKTGGCYDLKTFCFKGDRTKKFFDLGDEHICMFYDEPHLIAFKCPRSLKDWPNTEYISPDISAKYFPTGNIIKDLFGSTEVTFE